MECFIQGSKNIAIYRVEVRWSWKEEGRTSAGVHKMASQVSTLKEEGNKGQLKKALEICIRCTEQSISLRSVCSLSCAKVVCVEYVYALCQPPTYFCTVVASVLGCLAGVQAPLTRLSVLCRHCGTDCPQCASVVDDRGKARARSSGCTACAGLCPPRSFWLGRSKHAQPFEENKGAVNNEHWKLSSSNTSGPARKCQFEIGLRNRPNAGFKRCRYVWLTSTGHKVSCRPCFGVAM